VYYLLQEANTRKLHFTILTALNFRDLIY